MEIQFKLFAGILSIYNPISLHFHIHIFGTTCANVKHEDTHFTQTLKRIPLATGYDTDMTLKSH